MRSLRKVAILSAVFCVVFVGVLLLNQTLQLADTAARLHPAAGDFVFWGLVFTYLLCVGVPVVLFLRLPAPLVPPHSEADPAFEGYLKKLRRRLAVNPHLPECSLESRADVEAALAALRRKAEEVVKTAGSRVFLTTAISQNGSLDALLVLGLQTRLVWDVAHVYAQRPSLRELSYLYANVVGTAFVAGEIEDADLSDQIQPVLSSVLGSTVSALPGLQTASTLFVNSVISGTANAFLTLRVGLIAEEYCRALVRPARKTLRQRAVTRAAGMLGSIVAAGASKVGTAVASASARTVSGAVTGVGRKLKETGEAIAERLQFRRRDQDP